MLFHYPPNQYDMQSLLTVVCHHVAHLLMLKQHSVNVVSSQVDWVMHEIFDIVIYIISLYVCVLGMP